MISKDNSKQKKSILVLNIFIILFIFILAAAAIYCMYMLSEYSLLPSSIRIKSMIVISMLILIPILLLIVSKRSKTIKIFTIALSIVFSIAFASVDFYLYRTFRAIETLSSNSRVSSSENKQVAELVVLNESTYQTAADLVNKKVIAPIKMDTEFIQAFVNLIDADLEVKDSGSYLQAAKDLLDKKTDAIIVNGKWHDLIEESFSDFNNRIRVIYENNIDLKNDDESSENEKVHDNWPNVPFNIYLSGIDSYGEIETISRSDVNIVMSLNPSTKKILLTSIPRDTYCQIPDGGNNEYDKLTHAGIYGAKTSMRAINNLLGIDANRYVKINFSGLIDVVNSLGGVDVENPTEFKTIDYTFPAGLIHLDGEMALSFCRERNAFAEGDFERGRNQERVIKAIVKKLSSPAIIVNYSQILSSIEKSIETNFSTDEIMKLVNMQLENGFDWDIDMQSLEGSGRNDLPSYSMPGWQLYVMVPDETSLNTIKNKIQDTLKK